MSGSILLSDTSLWYEVLLVQNAYYLVNYQKLKAPLKLFPEVPN